MELEICLPLQTGRIKGGRISTGWFLGLENVENVFIPASRCSLREHICRVDDQGEAVEYSLEGLREREPRRLRSFLSFRF